MRIIDLSNDNEDHIPKHLISPYIFRGYRVGGTYRSCMKSLFMIHNETMNAWTMIFILFSSTIQYLFALTILKNNNQSAFMDYVVFTSLWLSMVIHIPFSVGYHIFGPINKVVHNVWRRLDVSCIFAKSNLLGLSISYYTYINRGMIIPFYVNMIGIFLYCVSSIRYVTGIPHGNPTPKKDVAQKIGFAVLLCLLPGLFQAMEEMIYQSRIATSSYIFGSAISLGIGAVLYVYHIPEKYYPGVFDIFGSSHQWMHVTLGFAHYFEFCYVLSGYYESTLLKKV